jgi:predicted dehydrogenase
MSEILRVGVIGANPAGSWGSFAHLPAIAALPNLKLTAVGAAHLESARETARRFGAAHAFDDPRALAEHPEVDVVAVCVRVPHHAQLVAAALDAGKHVYCEWPLGRDTAQAQAMAGAAQGRGVVHMTGLQARQSPVLAYVRDLIAEDAIGEVHASMLTHSVPWFFGANPGAAYLNDRSSGAHFLSIPGGHSIDAMGWLLGEFRSLQAVVARVDRGVEATGATGATSPNQVVVDGLLEDGAVASLRLQGAPHHGTGVRWEINGAKGDLVITAAAGGRGLQMADLSLQRTTGLGVFEDLAVPERYFGVPEQVRRGPPLNVARSYLELARAIQDGRPATPDFAAAVARHRTLDAVQAASDEGRRITLGQAEG